MKKLWILLALFSAIPIVAQVSNPVPTPVSAAPVISVTDNVSGTVKDTLTQLGSCTGPSGGYQVCFFYVCQATAGVNGLTVTYTQGGGGWHNTNYFWEVKGLHASCADKSAYDSSYLSVSASGGSFTGTATATTTQANELWLGVMVSPIPYSTNVTGYFTASGSWNTDLNMWNPGVGALFPSAIFNQIVHSTGTPSVTGTYTDEGGASFPISVATGVGAFH